MKKFLALSLSDVVFIMLINVKMPTIVGILTFMSRINFMLSLVEHGKSFITSGLNLNTVYEVRLDGIFHHNGHNLALYNHFSFDLPRK